jgi:hypothetical protein
LALQIDANGGTTTVDRILIPTLRRMRADYEVHEQLTPEQSSELMSSIAASVDVVTWSINIQETSTQTAADTSSAVPEATVLPADPPSLRVAGCASHHPAEEVLLSALKNAEPILNIKVIDSNPLPDDIATAAVETAPAAILIMLLPTGGFSQARFLCRAIRKQEYTGPIIVCCCGKFRHFDRLFAQFRKSGANFVTTSVAQTAVKLKSMTANRSSTNAEIERQLAS